MMNNEGYNTIGIDGHLDWKRIRKLFIIGLVAGIMVFIGDWLLGYGVADETLTGNERMLSAYLGLSDTRIFWSAFLGLIGIPLEGLCYFGIYRLMAERAPRLAHSFRSGVFGYLIFGACGVHVPCWIFDFRCLRCSCAVSGCRICIQSSDGSKPGEGV